MDKINEVWPDTSDISGISEIMKLQQENALLNETIAELEQALAYKSTHCPTVNEQIIFLKDQLDNANASIARYENKLRSVEIQIADIEERFEQLLAIEKGKYKRSLGEVNEDLYKFRRIKNLISSLEFLLEEDDSDNSSSESNESFSSSSSESSDD